MSNVQNDSLLELAHELEEYWQGTLHAELIRSARESGDLEQLRHHVSQAHIAQFDAEFSPEATDTV